MQLKKSRIESSGGLDRNALLLTERRSAGASSPLPPTARLR